MTTRDCIAESVERDMDMDMDRRAAQSMFDQSTGRLLNQRAQQAGTISFGEYLDLGLVPWAPDPFGSEHCTNLARLVEYMGGLGEKYGGFGPFEAYDLKCLYAASILYAIGIAQGQGGGGGRGEALGAEACRRLAVPGAYEARSAFLAEQFFRNGGGVNTYWAKPEVREETCRLIFRHNDPRALEGDPRLKVFADGRRYELARLNPNDESGESMLMLQREWVPELFHQGWAKEKSNARGWMITRGWK